jgi:hypothetical protein
MHDVSVAHEKINVVNPHVGRRVFHRREHFVLRGEFV